MANRRQLAASLDSDIMAIYHRYVNWISQIACLDWHSMTLKQRAYEHIRSRLLSGQLSPGSQLRNRALAEEIGVSQIPVREAISQLVSEGLAEFRPRLGAFVVELRTRDLEELYDLREALECHAVAKAVERRSDESLEDLERHTELLQRIVDEVDRAAKTAWTVEQIDAWMMAEAGFHLALLRTAGNRRAMKTVSDLRIMTQIFGRRWRHPSLDELRTVCREHKMLVDAIRRSDAAAACELMRKHLRRGCRISVEQLDRAMMDEAASQAADSALLRKKIQDMEERSR